MEIRIGEFKKISEEKIRDGGVQNFFHMGLDPHLAIFRYNALQCIDVMIHICKTLASVQTNHIYKQKEKNNLEKSIREIDILTRILCLEGYLKLYYNCFLTSEKFVNDAYEYVMVGVKYPETRTTHKLSSDVCLVCNDREAEENHHLIPMYVGGKDEPYNFVSVCHRCHQLDCFEFVFDVFKKNKFQLTKNMIKEALENYNESSH
jgi:hypothetical protein